jgi:NAD(P)-dependent dehydrogenase (short-subunit alcohol dehydrogenase family)
MRRNYLIFRPDLRSKGCHSRTLHGSLIRCERPTSTKRLMNIQRGDVNGMVRKVIDRFGVIHILVNNTGIGLRRPLLDTSEENWDRILAVDLRGVYLCTKYVTPQIEKDFYKCLSKEFPGNHENIFYCVTLE